MNLKEISDYIMKYELLGEATEYSKDYGDYEITVVKRDARHAYRSVDGIMYEYDPKKENVELYISEIEHTEGNTFYNDHVDRYVDYLNNDDNPILETFPINRGQWKIHLDKFLEAIWDVSHEKWDEMYDMAIAYGIKDIEEDLEKLTEMAKISNPLFQTEKNYVPYFDPQELEEFPEWGELDEEGELSELVNEGYTKEKYNQILRKMRDNYKKFLKMQEENIIEDYHLTDMNHRFLAVKEMGVGKVLAEII